MDGDDVNDHTFPAFKETDANGNTIELFCLMGRNVAAYRYTDKATGKSYWVGGCFFFEGQNKISKEKYNTEPNKGDWKKVDWFNCEPPPYGNDDWKFVFDTNTKDITVTKTRGKWRQPKSTPRGWVRDYDSNDVNKETYPAPEDINGLTYDGNSLLSYCVECDGAAYANMEVTGDSSGSGRWSYAFTIPSFGGAGTESDPITGIVADISPGDRMTIGCRAVANAEVVGDAADPLYGAWVVSSIGPDEVTFTATTNGKVMPGQSVGGFDITSNLTGRGLVPWDSSGEDIRYAGFVSGPAVDEPVWAKAEFIVIAVILLTVAAIVIIRRRHAAT